MASDEVEVFRGAAVFGRRELIESILRDEKIPYVIRSEGGIAEHPLTVGPMGEFIVLVSEDEADRARALLQEVQADEKPLEPDQEDELDQPVGLFSSLRRKPTPAQKRRYRWLGGALLVAGVILLFLQPAPIWLLGLLFLTIALAMIAESFK